MSLDEIKEEIFKKKQQIEALKQGLKEKGKGAIDKFTQIDEILYNLLQEQRRTTDQIELSNRLLYAIYQQGLGKIVPLEEISFKGGFGDLTTKVFNLDNPKKLGTKQEIFRIEGKGFVSEVKFISSNTDTDNRLYSVRIKCDDKIIYDDSWLNFSSRTLNETDVTCFNEDITSDTYILHFKNFFFIYSFTVELYNNSAEFTQIYIKYHEEI